MNLKTAQKVAGAVRIELGNRLDLIKKANINYAL